MERVLYHIFNQVEASHWWFVAYRRIIDSVIGRLRLPAQARILDAGCGNGANFPMLSRHGEVYASEKDAQALLSACSRKKSVVVVTQEALPQCSFRDGFFDLIVLLEVLEHVEDDRAALRNLNVKLKENGRMLVTVPAFPWLWSRHDVLNHHFRRYTRQSLKDVLQESHYHVQSIRYFNFWLFPVALAVRMWNKVRLTHSIELKVPPAWLNRLLTAVFASERWVINTLSFPFGISLIAIATRDHNAAQATPLTV